MQIALGTAQFGLSYGIAGRKEPVPENEVRAILEIARDCGIGLLDTAAMYGDIEERLARLCSGLEFKIVSKIPPVPAGLDASGAADFVSRSIERSRARLGERLAAVLFHRSEDLAKYGGKRIWDVAAERCGAAGLRLGASCYDPFEVTELRERFPVAIAQLPGNALDQRARLAAANGELTGVELHMRSVFLQGLLLMSAEDAEKRVPAAGRLIRTWRQWCDEKSLTPLQASLAIARSTPGAKYLVVGVDGPSHLRQIVDAWRAGPALEAPELACDEIDVVDPRRWSTA